MFKKYDSDYIKWIKYIDGGEVIDKIKIKVSEKDNAESLYNKVCINAKQIQDFDQDQLEWMYKF